MIDILTGKIAVVTGAATGIGKATAKKLAEWGASVIPMTARNIDGIKAVSEEIKALGVESYPVQINVADHESVARAFDEVVKKSGRIDILVNNAGIADAGPIPEIDEDRWNKVLDTNLKGTHFYSQAVLPIMISAGGGSIVNVTSQAGQVGGWLAAVNYSASKGGILALTKAYARYCAKYNIRVNDVAPGLITTEMTEGRVENLEEVALKRRGTSEEVANTIAFLASDLSSFITGTTIDINGGQFMRS